VEGQAGGFSVDNLTLAAVDADAYGKTAAAEAVAIPAAALIA
jgi:hypothetical protein